MSQPTNPARPSNPVGSESCTPQPELDAGVYELQRRNNRQAVEELGFAPYGWATKDLLSAAEVRGIYSEDANIAFSANSKTPGFVDPRPTGTVAGRVVLSRDGGKLLWMTLRDHSGTIQVAISQRDVPERAFKLAKLTDLSDILVVSGRIMRTKTGELTVWASDVNPGAKSLVPPPAKHDGLADVEIRYRQRYVDLWANPDTMEVFTLRSQIVSSVRKTLEGLGYLEVETPMLQALAGGAAARPFVTKMNALDINLFMRIAPELYLKRLLVGGLPRVFEINRNFRNEGLDKQHNPEFTMLEAYCAFGDVGTVMDLTETIIRNAARHVFLSKNPGVSGDVVLPFGEQSINYTRRFERVSYGELFVRAYGFEMTDTSRARSELRSVMPQHAAAVDAMDHWLVVNELFEHKAEGLVDHARPTFITDYPSAISPLTRPKRDNTALADRADLFIAGMEVAPHYTELNDPDVQESKFREQLRGLNSDKNAEENTYRTMDHDFVRALKVGMPPAGGMGLGIDRLVMLLTNQRTIRDVLFFPLMRPE